MHWKSDEFEVQGWLLSPVEIDPNRLPAHLFHVRRRLRSEHDFEYYA